MKKIHQAGFTLAEVLISIGIVSMVALFVSRYFLNTNKSIKEIKASNYMKSIADTILRAVQRPDVIAFSASIGANIELENCVYTNPKDKASTSNPELCTATNPEQQVPIHIYLPPKDKSSYSTDKLRVAGTERDPVYYSFTGEMGCDPKDPKCIFAAKAYFWATCPASTSEVRNVDRNSSGQLFQKSCFRAQTINIRFQVTHIFAKHGVPETHRPLNRELQAVPQDSSFWKNGERNGLHTTKYANSTNVSSLGLYSDYIESCPVNYTLIQVVDSKPVCKCLPPYKELTKDVCILADHKCLADERYMGTTLKGDPICKKVRCSTKIISLTDAISFDFDCSPDGWLNKIEVFGSSAKSCECQTITDGPNLELKTWEYLCQFNCPFKITCCQE